MLMTMYMYTFRPHFGPISVPFRSHFDPFQSILVPSWSISVHFGPFWSIWFHFGSIRCISVFRATDALGVTNYRNGPKWTEMDRNGTEMDRSGTKMDRNGTEMD